LSEKLRDIAFFRDNPYAIAAYLSEKFEENDREALLQAINKVMRAQNVQALAREAGLDRTSLYKTFKADNDPFLSRVMALFDALGIRLTVKALPPKPKPERPKLGRPPKKRSNP
jgi:probable addiction module antidote protein